MASKDLKDRDHPVAARQPGERGTAASEGAAGQTASIGAAQGAGGDAGGQHHAAKPHGKPAVVDESLPTTRSELLELHREARARRNSAPLDSEAFRAAVQEIARIEVRIAAIDRAQTPPLV
jgi:hypothetical protein